MCEEIIRAKGNITRIYHYSLNTKQGLSGRLFEVSYSRRSKRNSMFSYETHHRH